MRVWLARQSGDVAADVRRALEWIRWEDLVPRGSRVFIKPNLTWREPAPGVTTTPAFIAAVARALLERTDSVMIGESDGGYHSFSADEAFRTHGLFALQEQLGVRIVNLSAGPAERRDVQVAGRSVAVELPRVLLRDVDVFVTLPVPKVHAMTRVSLSLKNQWGCQPGDMRLRNHPRFPRTILAINKLVRPRIALYDGTHFLDRTGPMIGEPVPLNLIAAADDPGAGDLAICRLMGIDPFSIPYHRLARRDGMMPASLDGIELSRPLDGLSGHRFTLRRSPIQWVTYAAFRSELLTRLLYDSSAADPLHRVLFRIRRNALVGRLLYGRLGPPPAAEDPSRHR